jgi:hypothetical protein
MLPVTLRYARVMLKELAWTSLPSASFVAGSACCVKSAKRVVPIFTEGANGGGASSAMAGMVNSSSASAPAGSLMDLPFDSGPCKE